MILPARKINRLAAYDYSQGGVYFVTICTQDRHQILSDIVGDGVPVPKPVGEIAEEYLHKIPEKYPSVSIDQYVIMPDHIHILLDICSGGTGNPSPTIGKVIGWYKYHVTKCANLIFDCAGKRIFQRSYYDHVVRNQADYDETWQYIENNPRQWLLDKSFRQ